MGRPGLEARPAPAAVIAVPIPEGLAVVHDRRGDRLHATRAFTAGEPVFHLDHVRWKAAPDDHTVEHLNGRHFEDPVLARVARRRDANCRLSLEWMMLVARRDIRPGDVISANFDAPGRGAGAMSVERRCG